MFKCSLSLLNLFLDSSILKAAAVDKLKRVAVVQYCPDWEEFMSKENMLVFFYFLQCLKGLFGVIKTLECAVKVLEYLIR